MVDNVDQVKGKAKVAAGAATGNKSLENEGRVDRLTGDLKNVITDSSKKLESLATTAGDKTAAGIQATADRLLGLINKVRA